MPREANPCNKEVKREEAHEVWQTPDGQWTWYVLKKWQSPTNEAKNPYSRWFCNVVSPMTSERGETGDEYAANIKGVAVKLDYNPLVPVGAEHLSPQEIELCVMCGGKAVWCLIGFHYCYKCLPQEA